MLAPNHREPCPIQEEKINITAKIVPKLLFVGSFGCSNGCSISQRDYQELTVHFVPITDW